MASAAERHLRELAVARLRLLAPGARIVHELNVETGQCRVDLAAVQQNRLLFVEIKSRKDKLDRLREQCRVFRPACHGLAVCYASEKWSYSAVSKETGGGCNLWPENEPHFWTFWPRHVPPNTSAFLNLLWRDELHAEAEMAGMQPKRATPRGPLMNMLWSRLTGEEVVAAVCRQLRLRPFAEADAPISSLTEAA